MIDNETIRKVVINKALFPGGGSQEVVKSAESGGVNQTIQFTTNLRKPFHSVNYTIVPAQEGTGDPSPSNPRAIIGYTKVNMLLSAPGISKRNIVTFPGTLYGGEGDESGNFVNTFSNTIDLGSLNWGYYSSRFDAILGSADDYQGYAEAICEIYKWNDVRYSSQLSNLEFHVYTSGANTRIAIRDDSYSDATTFKTSVTGYKVLVTLATPAAVTVDPITFETFTSTQTARFEEKFPFTIEYLVSESEPANYAQQLLPIFYPDTIERSKHHDYS